MANKDEVGKIIATVPKEFADLKVTLGAMQVQLNAIAESIKKSGGGKKATKSSKASDTEATANGAAENKDKEATAAKGTMNNMNYFKHMFVKDEKTRTEYWKESYEAEMKADEKTWKTYSKKTGDDKFKAQASWAWSKQSKDEKTKWATKAKAAGGGKADTPQLDADKTT